MFKRSEMARTGLRSSVISRKGSRKVDQKGGSRQDAMEIERRGQSKDLPLMSVEIDGAKTGDEEIENSRDDLSVTTLDEVEGEEQKNNSRERGTESGVIYVGRIPHGFYEKQMRSYFSQFGRVLRLKISRNRRTGASKHYGFVEFESEDQAKIAAETMDNYLLSGHILKCKFIPGSEVPEGAFSRGRNNLTMKSFDLNYERKFNKQKHPISRKNGIEKLVARERKKRFFLRKIGIDYDFPGYAAEAKQFLSAAVEDKQESPGTAATL